ncbi:MAG: YciI family protein [Luteolibacter sp.]|uniref:YciI family protein n=1 Tax=Luteolibacter sp. TaxID=1962973 RepID=UPI003266BC6B
MKISNSYLALLRNTDWDGGLSAEEVAGLVEKYTVWIDRMIADGKITGGMPLLAGGRTITPQANGISDGPFIESKESIGGYLLVNAADYEEAVAIMKTFPPVVAGVGVEIRQITDICPILQRLEAKLASTTN